MAFAERVLAWGAAHGRRGLPWQPVAGVANPYWVWLSEVMLQQTQVATVLPAFERFIARFPRVEDLAQAEEAEVLGQWSGLGYYARARNLHRAAQTVVKAMGARASGGAGLWPQSAADWESLPGIGRSTAAALASVVQGERAAILDGNLKRLLARHTGCDLPWGSEALTRALWPVAEARLPEVLPDPQAQRERMQGYTQSMMDLGALVCTPRRPRCEACPVAADCVALAEGRTLELPRPKAVRQRPTVAIEWGLVADAGGVLLAQNPPTGVWAGLWVLPDWSVVSRLAPTESMAAQPWQELTHLLTHRRLEIRVWRPQALVEGADGHAVDGGVGLQRWAWPEALTLGIPTPVRRLLVQAARDLGVEP